MVWQTVYFNKEVDKALLIETITDIFKIHQEELLIVNDLSDVLEKDLSNNQIICEKHYLNNALEFKTGIEFIIKDKLKPLNDIIVYSKLVQKLDCKILVDGYSPYPDEMIIIESVHWNDEDLNPE